MPVSARRPTKANKIPGKPPGRRVGAARALSKLGLASRSVAAQWVRAGRVSINGKIIIDPESPVILERDELRLDGVLARAVPRRYVMLNKPRGLVTTARDEQERATVYSCFADAADHGLAPVGRLDKASEGLLLFTNDTEWAGRLLDPVSHLSKTYHVQLSSQLTDRQFAQLREGLPMEDGTLLKVGDVKLLRAGEKTSWLEIVLHEGKNRQIRRLIEACDAEVLRLIRVAIGPLALGELAKGESRALTPSEMNALSAALNAVPSAE